MRRDLDLIRQILFEIEKAPTATETLSITVAGHPKAEIQYHLKLLVEAGLIEAVDFSGGDEYRFAPNRLTWDGHEFLDLARDDTNWGKAKELAGRLAASLSLEALKVALGEIIRGRFF